MSPDATTGSPTGPFPTAVGVVGPGTSVPGLTVVVDRERMKTMAALLADPTPIHFDVAALRALGMGERPVNQGPLNMGYLQTMLARWAGGRDRILEFGVRFGGNVLAEDVVRAEGEVREVRSESRGVLATCDLRLQVQGGSVALTGQATVRLDHPSLPADPSPAAPSADARTEEAPR